MIKNQKILLVLFPYVFTKFYWQKYELDMLEKKYKIKIVIHQLIDFLSPNFRKSFKKKSIKGVFNFNSFYKWLLNFNKLKNRNILIFSFVESQNFYTFLVNFFIGRSSRPILKYYYPDVPELKSKISNQIIFNLNNKNFLLFNVIKIFFHKLSKILNIKYCDYLITSKKYYLYNKFILKKKIKISIGTALDYSNFLVSNKLKVKNYFLIKPYVVFLESPGPFNHGDEVLFGFKYPLSKENWSYSLNKFFKFIELNYKFRVVIASHPKVEHDKDSKYYEGRKISKYSTDFLIKNCEFVISRVSTAISFAIIYNKPIITICTNELIQNERYMNSLINFSKILGISPLNIDEDFNKNEFDKKIYINNKKYNFYLRKYLNDNKSKIPNYEIISKILYKLKS
jgi:hypothetical protein